jgi:hypothetical protein
VTKVPVVLWESGLKRYVDVDLGIENLMENFVTGCRNAFPEELSESRFKIYALAHDYKHCDIDNRHQITNDAQLREVVVERARPDICPREFHLFVHADNSLSAKFKPATPTDPASSALSALSVSAESHDSDASGMCRVLAKSACAFCGFNAPSFTTNVTVAHIFEVKDYNALRSCEEQVKGLVDKDLGHIHGLSNLICLCTHCQRQFEAPYNIGIRPATRRLDVKESILAKCTGKGKFGDLVGKKVHFEERFLPSKRLLEYRYKYFEQEGTGTVPAVTSGQKRSLDHNSAESTGRAKHKARRSANLFVK